MRAYTWTLKNTSYLVKPIAVCLSMVLQSHLASAQERNYHGTGQTMKNQMAKSIEKHGSKADFRFNGFGRLFALKAQSSPPHDLRALGNLMKEPADWVDLPARNAKLPSGYIFLGQFIDHDITLDTITQLDKPLSKTGIENARTVALDLDCVYGEGPERNPYLYNMPYLRVGAEIAGLDTPRPRYDLLRTFANPDNGPLGGGDTALIGDPRNDENFVVSQLQAAFISFHNRMVDKIIVKDFWKRRGEFCGKAACKTPVELAARLPGHLKHEIYAKTRDHVIHYYHRLIAEDFLPRLIGAQRARDIRTNGRQFYFPNGFKNEEAFIPLAFAGAAYRYGHAQVKQNYHLRDGENAKIPLFRAGGKEAPVLGFGAIQRELAIDWKYLFPITDTLPENFNFANKLSPFLASYLTDLSKVGITGPDAPNLAGRNLNRGRIYRLPSGQAIARLVLPKLAERNLLGLWSESKDWQSLVMASDDKTRNVLGTNDTPLWYYVLQEAAAFDIRSSNETRIAKAFGKESGQRLPVSYSPLPLFRVANKKFQEASGNHSMNVGVLSPQTSTNDDDGGMGQIFETLGVTGKKTVKTTVPAPDKQPVSKQQTAQITVRPDDIGGHSLGPVGGTIVGEVLFGLIDSYREKTGKGLDYVPVIKAEPTANNSLHLDKNANTFRLSAPLTATNDRGVRYQMRNMLYDAGVAFPVHLIKKELRTVGKKRR